MRNRVLSFAAAAALLLARPAGAVITGDLNLNGKIDVGDATLALRAAIGLATLTPAQQQALPEELNPTGGIVRRITTAEATVILRVAVGLLSPLDLQPPTLYALNGFAGTKGPGTLTTIDLLAAEDPSVNASQMAATPIGEIPNQMLIHDGLGFIVDSGSDSVQAIDLLTLQPSGPDVALDKGANPFDMAFLTDSIAYVTDLVTNDVAVVDTNKRMVVQHVATGPGPEGVAVADGRVFVANTNYQSYDATKMVAVYGPGTVSVIDPATNTVIASPAVGTNPQAIGLDAAGRLHVVCTGNFADIPGEVDILDPVSLQVLDRLKIGGAPGAVTFTPDGKAFLADSNNGVTEYDAATLKVLIPPNKAINPASALKLMPDSVLTVQADGRGHVWAALFNDSVVAEIDAATGQVLRAVPTGPGPEALAVR